LVNIETGEGGGMGWLFNPYVLHGYWGNKGLYPALVAPGGGHTPIKNPFHYTGV
jgi:hypothetical protein